MSLCQSARLYAAVPGRPERDATIGAKVLAHRGHAPLPPTRATAGLATAPAKIITDGVESGANDGATTTRVAPAVRLAAFVLLITVGGALGTPFEPGNTGPRSVNAQTKVHKTSGAVPIPGAVATPTKVKTTMNEEPSAGLEIHPLADILPLMGPKEFEALVEDIKAHGQLEPITVHQDKIVDGRNRYRACRKLGKVPDVVKWDGRGSLAAFVASKNVHRRHLSDSQRAMFAARFKEEFEKEAKANMSRGGQGLANLPTVHSRDLAAEAVNVSSRLVGSAEKVLKDGVPELAQAVKQGEVAVSAAAEVANLPPEEQAEVIAKGPEAVQGKAAAMRREKKAKKPRGTAPEPSTGNSTAPTSGSRTAAVDGQVPDEQWLKGLPLRSKLSGKNRDRFDREALHWRHVDALIGQIRSSDPGFDDEARDRLTHYAIPLLTHTFLHFRHPRLWMPCGSCNGKRRGRAGDACSYCRNVGFYIERTDDPFEQATDPVVDGMPSVTRPEQGSASRRNTRRPRGTGEGRKDERTDAAESSTVAESKAAKAKDESSRDKRAGAANSSTAPQPRPRRRLRSPRISNPRPPRPPTNRPLASLRSPPSPGTSLTEASSPINRPAGRAALRL